LSQRNRTENGPRGPASTEEASGHGFGFPENWASVIVLAEANDLRACRRIDAPEAWDGSRRRGKDSPPYERWIAPAPAHGAGDAGSVDLSRLCGCALSRARSAASSMHRWVCLYGRRLEAGHPTPETRPSRPGEAAGGALPRHGAQRDVLDDHGIAAVGP